MVRILGKAWRPSRANRDIQPSSDQALSVICWLGLGQYDFATGEWADWLPVITPVYPLTAAKVHGPNVVKELRGADDRAITFSRSDLPHERDLTPVEWHEATTYWRHMGIYG